MLYPKYCMAARALALLSILALLAGTFALGASAQQKAQRLSEEQRVLHVLNRLGFGARPGDVERVRAMGLERYIEQQLRPDGIQDAVAESKVQSLEALKMTTPELYAKYPQPGQLLRRLERDGKLTPEMQALRDNRKNAQAPAPAEAMPPPPRGADEMRAMEAEGAGKANAGAMDEQAKGKGRDYRQAMRDYYIRNGLRPPQQITAELQASRILRAVYSERQLQEVLVDFWTNHFNVFAGKGADRWLLVSYDRDTIRPNTLGKFKDLLVATAQSPAMLFYLDNFQSVSPNAQMNRRGQARQRPLFDLLMNGRGMRPNARRNPNAGANQMPAPSAQPQTPPQGQRMRRGINENYARELMELHTLGVDGGYTQKDVQEVARCFTGWTIFAPRGFNGGNDERAGTFYFNPRLHDDGEKLVLGHKIPAGGGIRDGLLVLDILAHHPSTAKHIAYKMVQRFVSDNPSPSLVERVAQVYMKSDGDIRETLRALFAAPEFAAPEAYRAKIKQPFELVVSSIRALGGETNGAPPVQQWIARMGQPLYGYQTPNGYADVAEAWVNTGALLERLNFGLALASNRIPGTRVDLKRFAVDAGSATDKAKVMERFLDLIVQGEISQRTRETLLKQLREPLPAATPGAQTTEAAGMMSDDAQRMGRRRMREQVAQADLSRASNPEVVKLVGLILGSPEFQRQ